MLDSIAMRLKILHLQDFNEFIEGELPLNYLLDKLAATALETVELEGMLPPFVDQYEDTQSLDLVGNRWEDDDEQA